MNVDFTQLRILKNMGYFIAINGCEIELRVIEKNSFRISCVVEFDLEDILQKDEILGKNIADATIVDCILYAVDFQYKQDSVNEEEKKDPMFVEYVKELETILIKFGLLKG